MGYLLVFILLSISLVNCSENTNKSPEDQSNNMNNFYTNRLDHTLTNLAITVASMDANIKNIQERAHIWDTFQLHVAAWNEQIKTLDRKVDIVNSGQEKMMVLDGKLGFLLNLEYNSQRIVNKLTALEDRLEAMEKMLKKEETSPLYNEFTTRGVLSSLRLLEHKADRTHAAIGQFINSRGVERRKNGGNETVGPYGRKIFVQCNIPPILEDLMKDVSSKVDLMYDKVTNPEEDQAKEDIEEAEEHTKDELSIDYSIEMYPNDNDSEDIVRGLKLSPNEVKVMRKVWKTFAINVKQNDTNENCNDFDTFMEDMKTGIKENNDLVAKVLQEERTDMNRIEEKIRNLQSDFRDIFSNYFSKNPILPCGQNQDQQSTTEYYENTSLQQNVSNAVVVTFDDNYKEKCKNVSDYIEKMSCLIMERIQFSNNSRELCEDSLIRNFCLENEYIIFQNRHNGQVSFARSWENYKWGFGDSEVGEYWLGNEMLHQVTKKFHTNLAIFLTTYDEERAWAEFDNFQVGSGKDNYILNVSGYRGNATDSFSYHSGSPFSSVDRKNDNAPDCCPCSESFGKGGWWFNSCFESNLNGLYTNNSSASRPNGMIWEHWRNHESLAKTTMAVKWKYDEFIEDP